MTTRRDANTATPRLRTSEDWIVSHNKGFRANIIVWGMPKDLPTLEIRAKLADLGLDSFVRGAAFWVGEHVKLVLTPDDSKRLTKELVSQVSASLRKNGCRCVLDDVKSGVIVQSNGRKRVNKLHKVISNRNINLSARRLLLLSVIRPSMEYGSEVWEGNKSQAGSLESIILDGAKRILGCSSKTCNRQLEEIWA